MQLFCTRFVVLLLATVSVATCNVVYMDSNCAEAQVNTSSSYFGSNSYDIASIKDVVRTTLTRFESSMYNNTLRCDMQLDLMGACLDELVLEVYSGAYVTIKGATGMLQPGDKAITGTFMVRGTDQVGSFFNLKPVQEEDDAMLVLLSLPLFGAADEGGACKVAYEADSAVALNAAFMGMGFVSQSAGDTQEDVAAANSMQWLWDRKASLTKERVKSRDVRARKSLGQNYLINEAVLETIISKTGVQPGDCVLEVGPGTGNLTKHLLLKGARVLAIEKDQELAEKLQAEFSNKPIAPAMLRIVTSDVLRVNLRNAIACCAGLDAVGTDNKEEVVEGDQDTGDHDTPSAVGTFDVPQEDGVVSMPAHRPRIIIVANLPFYITKDFLQMLLPMGDIVSHVYLLLQEEVATRLIEGGPGDRNYRAANLELLFYSLPKYLFTIGRTSFFPPPKCNGAFVELQLRLPTERPVVDDHRAFVKFLSAAFSQRRKMLYNSLVPLYSTAEVTAALQETGLPENTRPQDLGLAQYVELYNTILARRRGAKGDTVAVGGT